MLPNIFQVEGHNIVSVGAYEGDETCLLDIFQQHGNLVIPRIGVHEGLQLMLDCGIYYLVNSRSGEAVFRTCTVQVRIN